MKDNLEDFIREKREDFDLAQPDLKVWAGIEQSLGRAPEAKRFSLWRSFAAAASVVLLLGLGISIGMQINQNASGYDQLGDVSLEHREIEQYYEKQLQEKKAILAKHNTDPSVKADLQQLEDFLAELQKELQEVPKGNEEVIINAMIENYQDRLEILERVLSRVQAEPNHSQKSKNDEEINL